MLVYLLCLDSVILDLYVLCLYVVEYMDSHC